ncbi:venom serine protease 34 [Bombus terrestris]|uniref:Venom serine protease 34 n=1 Tax=Bombus terrestris TaxID=30195 RepID=A0A9B0BRA6_BOMTE|nr:venom serine protease 34 [Bombus terrestris]
MLSIRTTAFHGFMIQAAVLLFCWSIFSIELSNAANSSCTYYHELTPGATYFIQNREYPNFYSRSQSCSWTIVSEYKVDLTCSTFELPWSSNCFQDKVAVQVNSSTTHRYCGNGQFNIQSESNTMVVTLQSPIWSRGGRFACEVRSVKRSQDSENCECGWKNPSRIVGGNNTGVNEFPMMVGIVDFERRVVFCGGTIISTRYVLTAAHCVDGREYQKLGALVGDHDLRTGSDTNATVLHRIIKIIIHPNYGQRVDQNDVAIIKTENEIKFTNEVGPACLPFQHSPDTFGGNYVELLGWGTTDYGGPTSDILQKVTLSVLSYLQCSENYENITSDQICTYAENKDSCQMDSGGPVLWQNPTTRRLVLIGIIARGRGCAVVGGVNTRVGAYIDWIISATSDASYCIIE